MVQAIVGFFSSFNPIVFSLALSGGAIILFRRPSTAPALPSAARDRDLSAGNWRRTR